MAQPSNDYKEKGVDEASELGFSFSFGGTGN
jgi:hypothetical protein